VIEFLQNNCPTTPFTVGDNLNDVEPIWHVCMGVHKGNLTKA